MRSALPTIQGMIDRRALVNFRIDPARLDGLLPPRLRPQLVSGWAIGGICLIRLKEIRAVGLPGFVGVGSENAAHRIAVEWDEAGERRTGVFIPRRDSSSRVNTLLGGRIFPGFHHRADFAVDDGSGIVSIEMRSRDDVTSVRLRARVADRLADTSVFDSTEQISAFFRKDPSGSRRRGTAGSRVSSWRRSDGRSSRSTSSTWRPRSSTIESGSRRGRWSSTARSSCVTSGIDGTPARISIPGDGATERAGASRRPFPFLRSDQRRASWHVSGQGFATGPPVWPAGSPR